MQLIHLLNLIGLSTDISEHISITGISNNSKTVEPGYLFVAIPGHAVDGHNYIDHAISKGATAVIGERNVTELDVPYIQVKDSRKILAQAARAFYYPENQKTFIGITGTNGKTTTAFMLQHILKQNGITCSLFSSVYNEINGEQKPTINTTSDALELYKQLANSQDQVVILEVTSHALIQHRVEGIEFDCCIFTNLSQDHLDYHVNMEDYFKAKTLLFDMLKPNGKAIINTKNEWGKTLAEELNKHNKQVLSIFGADQDVVMTSLTYLNERMHITLAERHQQTYSMNLSVLGEHNAYNAVMAFTIAKALSIPPHKAISALESFKGAPGRFNRYKHPSGGEVVIDYAHTEEAFLHCLKTAKDLGAKRIIHVFGFRGNRDKSKQQSMIDVSLELSDFLILTMDDLDNESSTRMQRQLKSFNLYTKGVFIADRFSAIKKGWSLIKPGDWLFITGKGQEPYETTTKSSPTSDNEAVELLST